MRAVIAAALALVLPVAGLGAPFVHAHPDDHATDHHGGRALHAHAAGHAWSHHAASGPALDTADHDRAVYVSAFVAVPAISFSVQRAAVAAFQLVAPVERAAHRPVDVVHGHDPPSGRSLPPRAPPLHLS